MDVREIIALRKEQAADFVAAVAKRHKQRFVEEISERGKTPPFDFKEPYLKGLLQMFLRQYMEALDMAEIRYFDQIKSASFNQKLEDIDAEFERRIAAKLDEHRQQAIGIEQYVWRTVGDSRVRDSHAQNDGVVFSWADVPETGHPGEDFGCRCHAEPVVSEGFEVADSGAVMTDGVEIEEDDYESRRRYPRPKVGEKIEVSDKDGNVPDRVNIFIGGAGDRTMGHNVEDSHALHKNVPGENYYFTHDSRSEINDLIKSLPTEKEINAIGHSWGGDTAAGIALDNPGRINMLITLDPVTTFFFAPDFEELNESSGVWVDINAVGRPGRITGGDTVAKSGKWGDDPIDYADHYLEAPYSHEEVDSMLNHKPMYDNIEDILDDEKNKLSALELINQRLP